VTTSVIAASTGTPTFEERRRTADRIFRGTLYFNAALTLFWLFTYATGRETVFYAKHAIDGEAVRSVVFAVLFLNILWGFIWYGIKTGLLKYVVGFSKEERRAAFASRMRTPFDVKALTAAYSERRIRIVDMIGRRGRFITLATAGFYLLYRNVAANPTASFAAGFLHQNLFEAVANGWIFLSFYYADGFIARAMYGPQSRVMDGVLARANCLLITTLWTAFKFVLVPIGTQLAQLFPPREFAAVFAMIWGSYIACDGVSEIVGALFGSQRLRVWGIGDVNRKSIEGTIAGFAASLVLCLVVVNANALPASWIYLSVAISISNTVLELWSPRGTDDFTMATANALICWTFGVLKTS